jgi:hypothetical protein
MQAFLLLSFGVPVDQSIKSRQSWALSLPTVFVAKKVVQVEEANEWQVVLRPNTLVILVLRSPRNLISCQDVSDGEDTGVGRADCRGMSSADVAFERLRSAVNVVAAATCADLPAAVEDDPSFIVLSEPETWWLGLRPGMTA